MIVIIKNSAAIAPDAGDGRMLSAESTLIRTDSALLRSGQLNPIKPLLAGRCVSD